MHCKDVCELLSPYLDGFLEPEEQREVARHLESCAECQAQYADLQHTVELLRGLPEVTPPTGFRKQLRVQLQSLEQPVSVTTGPAKSKGHAARRNWPGLLAAAAVLVVALGISGLWQGSPAHWAASGENLLARVFAGSGQSDKLALEDQAKASKQGDPEQSAGKLSQNDAAPTSEAAPESMRYDIATAPDGLGGGDLQGDYAPGAPNDKQIMVGLSGPEEVGGEPLMIPLGVSSNDNQLAREAQLIMMVSEPVRVAAEITELGKLHNAQVTSSDHGDKVALELKVALADFEPLWDELQSYGRVLDSSIVDHDLAHDIESAEATIQKLNQSAKLDQLKDDILEQQRLLQELQKQAGTAVIKLELNK